MNTWIDLVRNIGKIKKKVEKKTKKLEKEIKGLKKFKKINKKLEKKIKELKWEIEVMRNRAIRTWKENQRRGAKERVKVIYRDSPLTLRSPESYIDVP